MKKSFRSLYFKGILKKASGVMMSLLFVAFILGIQPAVNAAVPGFPQQAKHTVKGVVKDDQGVPIPGVNVVIKGTTTGTVTDINGNYQLNAGTNDVLVFSFIGFTPQEIEVGDKGQINIILAPEVNDLEEVVVVGYGVTKKKLTTGANLNVKGENISELAPDNAINALQGISPGVSLTRKNGMPGEKSKINIRGMGTIGNSNPLYIVDGVTVDNIDYLSPSDIESIDVLKDAASAAIYGSRAANGVILVTTKKGTQTEGDKVNISLNSYWGWQNVYKKPDVLNAQEYALIQNEGRLNEGKPLWNYAEKVPDWDKIESGQWHGTNWFDEMTRKNAMVQNYALNMSWGNKRSVYALGASYFSNDGVLGKQVDPRFKRLTIRLNSDHVLYEKDGLKVVSFGENFTYTNSEKVGIKAGNIYWNDIRDAFTTSPFLPLYDSTGSYHYAIPWNVLEYNPIGKMEYDGKYVWPNNNTMVGNVYLNVQPIKGLTFRTSFGFNSGIYSYRHWVPEYQLSDNKSNSYEWTQQSMGTKFAYTFTNTVSYDFNLNRDNQFKAMVGTEMYKVTNQLSISGKNQNGVFGDPLHAYLDNYPIVDPSLTHISGKDSYGHAILSYFGRLTYNFKERYLFTAVLRSDGSSNFAEGHRWGIFPSVAAGWVISNEDFLKNNDVVDFLKLRASWGQNGNQNIGAFQYSSSITYVQSSYFFGPDKTIQYLGGYPSRVPNPNVTWETSQQADIGVDAYFLDSRLKLNLDWYDKRTKDWLVTAPILATAGTNPSSINGGTIDNTGIEIALGWNDIFQGIKYGVTGTFAYNHNEITEIANDEGIIHGPSNVITQGIGEIYRAQVGYPIGYFWGFQTDGIIQNQAEADQYNSAISSDPRSITPGPGDFRFVDQNGDGVIDDDDKIMLGDPNPDFNFALQLNLEYKGAYLNFTGVGQAGMQVIKSYRNWNKPWNNYTTDVFDRWHGEGTSNTYPKITASDNQNMMHMSDFFVEDASFFRISSVTVGYDLSKLDFWPLKQSKIYFQGQNLLILTGYSGLDPEVGYGANNWASGIDIGNYPMPRSLLVGLQINF